MRMEFFRGETITIIRKTFTTTYDEWGQPSTPSETIEVQGVFGHRSTSSTETVEEQVDEGLKQLAFDPGTVIYPDDQFVIRGTLWEKDGESLNPVNIFKRILVPEMVIVPIKQVKGNRGQVINQPENDVMEESNGG